MDTTTAAPPTATIANPAFHRHTTACWWDHLRPGWVCPAPTSSFGGLR